jgi:hypothetical protein
MEYNGLLGEVSRMKNQIMAHANCHDPNIDKWIENEARRFVQGPQSTEYPQPVGFPGPGPYANTGGPSFAMGYEGYADEGEWITGLLELLHQKQTPHFWSPSNINPHYLRPASMVSVYGESIVFVTAIIIIIILTAATVCHFTPHIHTLNEMP